MPFTRLRQSLIKPNGSITGSLSGTSSYSRRALTASYALNASGGSISYITGSPVVGQYIVVSGSSTTQYALIQSVSNPEHLLVSVNGDPNTHGGGNLSASSNNVFINTKLVVNNSPDSAAPDGLCAPVGGAHCSPITAGGSPNVFTGD